MVHEIWSAIEFFGILDQFLPLTLIFHYGLFFCPFTPLTLRKKNLKNEKNAWTYHNFTRVPKILITRFTIPKIWCATDGRTDGKSDIEW